MKHISNWIFHYNDFTNTWQAAKRENYNQLFSGDKGGVLSSPNVLHLTELISKTGGDPKLIEELLEENKNYEEGIIVYIDPADPDTLKVKVTN